MRIRGLAGVAACALLVSGCVLLEVRRQQERIEAFAEISGTVRTEHQSQSPLVVVLLRIRDLKSGQIDVFDHFVREGPGVFFFTVSPGEYRVIAFEDRDADLHYDPDEPIRPGRVSPQFRVDSGESHDEGEVVIPTAGRTELREAANVLDFQARTVRDQLSISLGALLVRGAILDLSDDRFGAEAAKGGLWRPLDFLHDVGAGVYFAEPYDPKKIPVLFVHGVNGYPREFEVLAGSLPKDRFQSWFFFYPSGFPLGSIAERLAVMVSELQVAHRFDRMAVVAHSMGGLVSRDFLLRHFDATGRREIEAFVSISTPWAGHAAAQTAVHAPIVVYSWLDMAPTSQFLRDLFYLEGEDGARRRRLPKHIEYHLLFGYEGGGKASDGVISLESQLRIEAQREARSSLGLHETHTGILRSSDTTKRLNAILTRVFD